MYRERPEWHVRLLVHEVVYDKPQSRVRLGLVPFQDFDWPIDQFSPGLPSVQSGCPSPATLRTSSEIEGIGSRSGAIFRTKSFSIGLVVGISSARNGIKHGIYYQNADGALAPIIPFLPTPRKPTLRDLAQRMAAPKTLGERIRFMRLRRGLRQDELAKILGVYNSAVCQWEKGLTEPRPEYLNRLGQLLGVSARQLIAGS